jgi:CDP-diacylglycerol--serine O-phosphatidyltransferase
MNLVCGFYAVIQALDGYYLHSMLAIFAAALFDFSDGLAARLLKAYSPIGKDLDSLADLVSFGVAPGAMLYCFIISLNHVEMLKFVAFVIPVFSALRLAKFNNDTRQTTSFLGLPVPAHAILWSSLIVALANKFNITGFETATVITLAVLSVMTSLLLVSELPMFSLKMKSLSFGDNKPVYIQLAASALLISFFGIVGIAGAIAFYVLLSLFFSAIFAHRNS